MNKKDIENRDDIEFLVRSFYQGVQLHPLLAPYFSHVAWETHLPHMFDFWQNILFFTGGFHGNPVQKHVSIHEKFPLTAEAFAAWLGLFEHTVTKHFEGPKATLALQRARSIATVMQIKIAERNRFPLHGDHPLEIES